MFKDGETVLKDELVLLNKTNEPSAPSNCLSDSTTKFTRTVLAFF